MAAPQFDPTWSTGLTLSNNDRTIKHPDATRKHMALSEAVRIRDVLGTKQYIEFEITAWTGSATPDLMVVGLYSDLSSPGNDLSNPQQRNEWGADLDRGDDIAHVLERGPFTSTNNGGRMGDYEFTGDEGTWTGYTAGDRIGFLIEFGVTSLYPFCTSYRVYYNGTPQGSWRSPWPAMGDLANRTLRPGFTLDPGSGNTDISIEIKAKADWLYEPDVVPNVQEWGGSIVTPTLADNSYCRLIPGRLGFGQDPVSATANFGAALSNKDLTNTMWRATNGNQSMLSITEGSTPRVKGKYYFELAVDDIQPVSPFTTGQGLQIGIHNSWSGLSMAGGGSDVRYITYEAATKTSGNSGDEWSIIGGSSTPGPEIGGDLPEYRSRTGDVYMFACDLADDADGTGNVTKCWIGVNGTWANNNPTSGTGDVSTRSDGTAASQAWFPAICMPISFSYACTKEEITANFGGTAFTYTPPTGFSAWDDTPVPV
jgi:hypothetical protein